MIDNSKELLRELIYKSILAFDVIGMRAEDYAKLQTPVDTGRLRNSINYDIVVDGENVDAYVGTNVEYAANVELNERAKHKTGKAHFLRDAAARHGKEYKAIYETILMDDNL